MECRLLLDVVVAQCSAIFKLLAGEDQAMPVCWDAFLAFDLALDIIDRVPGLDLEGDGLAREGLDEAVEEYVSLTFHDVGFAVVVGEGHTSAL